ncbi:MAG: RNA polymerase-binding protein RbpA [Actinomycetaceae bacterium]|nr:RNA polymerase-binding protein RbpA [Actinomycetaceae bacterium]
MQGNSVSTAEIEYFCARGHVTRVSFSAAALFDVPSKWECEVCHEVATRTPPGVKPVDGRESDAPTDRRAMGEAQARRTEEQREQILQEALEKLREKSD